VIAFRKIDDLRAPDGQLVPGFLFEPREAIGGVVVVHGHGGSKETNLGLAAHLAEARLAALAIDLRGHGEHPAPLDQGVLGDVDAATSFARRYGPVAVVGKSLGGCLALMSAADAVVAVSPAIPKGVSPEGRTMFVEFPPPGVREPYPGYVLDLLKQLGPPPVRERPTLLLSAPYDVQTIRAGTREFAARLPRGEYREVDADLYRPVNLGHPLLDYLPYWFNHSQLQFHPQVLRIVPEWLRDRFGEGR
jgi:pimeloyl-ACP methyl ester carboxylesterase